MKIEFTGRYTIDPEFPGVRFEAKVDERLVACKVSQEALQDMNPGNANAGPLDRFQANQETLQEIARLKILAGELENGPITIISVDVKA